MARPKNQTPVYKLHSTTGLARCWVGGRWVSLGKFGSPESRAAFARILAELAAGSVAVAPTAPATVRTVDQLLLAFLAHADQHYRRADGTATNQIVELKCAIKPLHKLYGHTAAHEFGPLALKAVRAEMVNLDWCRNNVNNRIGKLKHIFKWAASEQLVPVTTYTALATVAGLQKGRTKARETDPIGPVDRAHVEATLPFLGVHVRGLVEFQRLAGCRPGEACRVRRCDIDTTGDVWVWNLDAHKTARKGKARFVAIGPKGQEVLKPFFTAEVNAYLFDPRTESARASLRYTTHSYYLAVRRAAERAGVPHWHPNQIRHTFGTMVRKEHGLEAAQVLLGHARADVTQVYAEKNLSLALELARMVG